MHRSGARAAAQSAQVSETVILELWDRYFARGEFPLMHTGPSWAYGRARLSAFREPGEWLTVFEVLVYHMGSGDFENLLCAYGNRLRRVGVQDPTTNLRAQAAAKQGLVRNALRSLLGLHTPPSPREARFLAELNTYGIRFPPEPDLSGVDGFSAFDDWWCQNPLDFELTVCGTLRRFHFTPDDYAQAGIDLDAPISEEPHIDRVIRVMRILCEQLPPDKLFYPPDVLLQCLGRTTGLTLFLQLDAWCHPGLSDLHRPRESPSFRSLAQALASNRPELYYCPPDLVNTHWSHWPRWHGVDAS